ncbi:hypothetical protein [Ruegeria sp. HKCCA5763]|uniref:hypothetical protein n=1 Tax=Ruegeria sp. HKCCA5763 TaxID=2682987 RepID=UPI0014896CF2|nr:hypothetical protein [Ruegeria sp. HKCCA5763]
MKFSAIILVALSMFAPFASAQETTFSGEALRTLFTSLNGRIDEIANGSRASHAELAEELNRLESSMNEFRLLEDRISELETAVEATGVLRDELLEAIEVSSALNDALEDVKNNSSAALQSAEDAQTSARLRTH